MYVMMTLVASSFLPSTTNFSYSFVGSGITTFIYCNCPFLFSRVPCMVPILNNLIHSKQQDQYLNPSSISRQKMVCFNKFQSANHRPIVNQTIDLTQQVLQITGRCFKPSTLIPYWGIGWNTT